MKLCRSTLFTLALFACAVPLPAAEVPSEPPHEVFSKLFGHALDYGLWLSPYYWDPAIQRVLYTTSPCYADWNAEAYSTVWPESREGLLDTMAYLKSGSYGNLVSLIAIFEGPEDFGHNCRRMEEAQRVSMETDKAETLLSHLAAGNKDRALRIVWKPSADNVSPLIALLQRLSEWGRPYCLSIQFED